MEDASLPDRLSGRWHGESGRRGAGGNAGGRAKNAAACDAELWARAHGGDGDVGHVALADEYAARRYEPRHVLAAVAAVAGGGYAGSRGGVCAEPKFV